MIRDSLSIVCAKCFDNICFMLCFTLIAYYLLFHQKLMCNSCLTNSYSSYSTSYSFWLSLLDLVRTKIRFYFLKLWGGIDNYPCLPFNFFYKNWCWTLFLIVFIDKEKQSKTEATNSTLRKDYHIYFFVNSEYSQWICDILTNFL